jgi:hypothetical protein
MTATAPITLEWLSNENNKFSAFKISVDALNLINKSETLKSDIRAYAANNHVVVGEISSTKGLGQYNTYVAASELTGKKSGYLEIAADRFNTPESTVDVLAHELGHFRVEEPGAVIATARANAWTAQDKLAYENACNLTEGYARLNEVRVGNELVEATRAQAAAEHRQLTVREQIFVDRWSGNGVFSDSQEGSAHNIVKAIEDAAKASGKSYTTQEIQDAAAFALGENNKNSVTSSTGETYLDFCKRSAEAIKSSGAAPAPASEHGQEQLQTTYDADGSVVNSSVTMTHDNGDQTATVFNASGHTLRRIETDGAYDNADYATRTTSYDVEGRDDWVSTLNDDGSRDATDFDQTNVRPDRTWSNHIDAQGREDWSRAVNDDGSVDWPSQLV